MSKYIDFETLKFILYKVNDLPSVLARPRYADYDMESTDMFLNSIKDFSDKDLFPVFKEMDEQAAVFKDGTVEVHPAVLKYMKKAGELGLIASMFDYDDGGLQIPGMVHTASNYIQEAANNHLPGYAGLTLGAAELIVHFANEELNKVYVPNMLAGKWGGTMCLTEPQAGSSLSDIVTTAVPTGDGSYQLKGQKIFISGGDYQGVENVVHLVLARIEGAPAGTKGISLFVVPKNRPAAHGGLEPNDVLTAGDFQKMGQKGYATTHLMFGENDNCQGWLVGEAHKGLKYMFLMMNGARIGVGRGAAAIAMAAYQASLTYANERAQGRAINNSGRKNVEAEQTLIINHPDVRRMLLLQKVIVEGSLSLVLKASRYVDIMTTTTNEAEKEKYELLTEILLPVVKTYSAEKGAEAVSNGLQVLGGYGFCSEYILQQYHRDIRIFSIYEGTTGIQSLDLLGRKVTMKGGAAVQALVAEMMTVIVEAGQVDALKPYAKKLGDKLIQAQEVLGFLTTFAKKGEYQRFVSDASLFMEFFSNIVIAWLWLEMALEAKKALLTGDQAHSTDFYESKVHAMKFFFKYELSKNTSLAETIMNEEVLTLPTEKKVFV